MVSCPYCGCEKVLVEDEDYEDETMYQTIYCKGCKGSFTAVWEFQYYEDENGDYIESMNDSTR